MCERSLRSLYCCSGGVRGRSAPVTNLSHSATFHSFETIAPSNRGIKHHAAIRIFWTKDAGGGIGTGVSTLHRDAQGSVRVLTTATGIRAERTAYRPFGEETVTVSGLLTASETNGYIGERFDADAGLRFLSALSRCPAIIAFPGWSGRRTQSTTEADGDNTDYMCRELLVVI